MGKLLGKPTKKLFGFEFTTGIEILIIAIVLGGLGYLLYLNPIGLGAKDSIQLDSLSIDSNEINNSSSTKLLDLATTTPSLKVISEPKVRIAGYGWNAQTAIYNANGGANTTKGSLMEQYNVNLELVRQDWLSELTNMQFNAVKELDRGVKQPKDERSAVAIMIMGDGGPFYLSTRQKALNDKFGKGKYHLQIIATIGMSNGEDKLIGPLEWKTNPKSMLGSLISVVIGDGDWVVALNYCFANGLKVNPDFTTYDANAVNFYPSADDDYINSAKELIASQTNNFKIPLKEVINGELTGKTIDKKIDGCATWTPGDKMVFDALTGFTDVVSTKDFPNQMPTTVIIIKEWADANPEIVSNILRATLTAANQMKQYDSWRVRGSEAIAKGFNLETPKYWYDMYQGQTGSKAGVEYSVGGSRTMNYADVMQYYGVTDGTDRYKSVYEQVSKYLLELNPFDFKSSIDGIIPYEDAVNLRFLKSINDIDTGEVTKTEYGDTKTEVMASGEWNINFATGSNSIQSSSNSDLETIYNLLVQAEQTKISVVGHTDNTGSNVKNMILSKTRAESVVEYLLNKGIPIKRIQLVDGKGSSEPVETNDTASGRAKNRRVDITLFQ